MKLEHLVSEAEAGRTALSVLADLLPDVRTRDLRELCEAREVTREGHPCGAGEHLAAGDRLVLEAEEEVPRVRPAKLKGCEVLHLSEDLLALTKPPGVATEGDRFGDPWTEDAPLRAAVLRALVDAGRTPLPRPRFVHRLDKETSGVLLVALSHAAMRELSAKLAGEVEERVSKCYVALVEGRLAEEEGVVELPLTVESGRRKAPVRGDEDEGKPAITRFERLEVFERHTWVRLWPETGRTHQLRVHLAHLGYPIVCDGHYGTKGPLLLSQLKPGYKPKEERAERPLLDRLALHAESLELTHRGEALRFEAPLPKDLRVTLKQLEKLRAATKAGRGRR